MESAKSSPHPFGVELQPARLHRSSYGRATHTGYTLRTERHRYVEWRDLATGVVTHRELYDQDLDPAETANPITDPAYQPVAAELSARAADVVSAGGRWRENQP